jgi:hypothetical protein
MLVKPIVLVLKDQQSLGKRSLHLMDTVNEKKRRRRLANERAFFLEHLTDSLLFYSVSGNANSMVRPVKEKPYGLLATWRHFLFLWSSYTSIMKLIDK